MNPRSVFVRLVPLFVVGAAVVGAAGRWGG